MNRHSNSFRPGRRFAFHERQGAAGILPAEESEKSPADETSAYVFTVAAGILPAVEPGILPGGNGVSSEKALAIWRLRPGGKTPLSTAAKLAAATHLLPTVNIYGVFTPL